MGRVVLHVRCSIPCPVPFRFPRPVSLFHSIPLSRSLSWALAFGLWLWALGFSVWALRFALCALRFVLCVLRFALCALRFVLCALRFALLCAVRFRFGL